MSSPHPAGRYSGTARVFLIGGDGSLVVFDLLVQPVELRECLLTVAGNLGLLDRIGLVHVLGGQGIDLGLQRGSERLIAFGCVCSSFVRPDQ